MSYWRSPECEFEKVDKFGIAAVFAGVIAVGASFVKNIFGVKAK